MKNIDLGQGIGILANLGVIAGIVFLGFELRQNTRATELASTQNFLSTAATIDLLVTENAEVADILSRDPPELTNAERLRVDRFRYSAFRQWENTYYLYSVSMLDEDFWLAFRNNIERILDLSTGMDTFWLANKSSFTPAFQEEMEKIIQSRSNE